MESVAVRLRAVSRVRAEISRVIPPQAQNQPKVRYYSTTYRLRRVPTRLLCYSFLSNQPFLHATKCLEYLPTRLLQSCIFIGGESRESRGYAVDQQVNEIRLFSQEQILKICCSARSEAFVCEPIRRERSWFLTSSAYSSCMLCNLAI